MLEVVPAILPKTFAELEEKLDFLAGATTAVQIDVTDGQFAGQASWPLGKHDMNFDAIVREERGMPHWEEFEFEFDLMMSNPFSLIPDLIRAGAHKIVIHAESINLDDDQLLLDQLRTEGVVQVGIAFNQDADEKLIREFLPFADFVQFMGIAKIGFQGQPFSDRVLSQIRFLKHELLNMPIAVDGAMNPETAALVVDAGATKIISGSYVLNSENPAEAIRELEGLI
jgi:ribulose-phosphate 3-epimerase